MKMMTRLLAMVLALLMCVPALAETTQSPDDVMATVNGVAVTRASVDEYLLSMQNYYASVGYDVESEEIADLLKGMAVDMAVEYVLMDQKIVELGLALTDAERADAEQGALDEFNAVIEDGMAYYGITAESTEDERAAMLLQILAELESFGYTEASYIAEAVKFAGYDKLQAEMLKDVTVSDEDVVAYYNDLVAADKVAYENDAAAYENMVYMNQMYLMYGMADYYTDIFYKPEGFRKMTHILLTVDEAVLAAYTDLQAAYEEQQIAIEEGTEVTGALVTAEEVEAARLAVIASVQDVIDEIMGRLAAGESFAALIPEYSTDPGMQDAASIEEGYEVHMDSIMWDPAFRDASFTVNEIGDVTAPVVGSYGVHILQYAGDAVGGALELSDDLREVLRSEMLETEKANVYNDMIAQWAEEADIVYSDEAAALLDLAE